MKKLFCFVLSLFLLTGCGNMGNTPTKRVEELLNKYQTNDESVLADLDDVLMGDINLTDDERNDYRDFMKKHYEDMKYKIKNETIDGDSATVEAEITVRDYSSVVNDANNYRIDNSSEFNDENTFASYRLDKLRDVTDTQTYTITFHLTKVNDKWTVDPLTSEDESKLNGLFGVYDVNRSSNSDAGISNQSNVSTADDNAGLNDTDNNLDTANDNNNEMKNE